MVIPRSLRDQAGVSEGTLINVAVVKNGPFLITPQVSINRSLVVSGSQGPQTGV